MIKNNEATIEPGSREEFNKMHGWQKDNSDIHEKVDASKILAELQSEYQVALDSRPEDAKRVLMLLRNAGDCARFSSVSTDGWGWDWPIEKVFVAGHIMSMTNFQGGK